MILSPLPFLFLSLHGIISILIKQSLKYLQWKKKTQERIAKGKETRGKGDYPTMDDVLSDWDSEKDGKKPAVRIIGQFYPEKPENLDFLEVEWGISAYFLISTRECPRKGNFQR